MSNYRYHIHLACVYHDVSIQTAQDDLSVFFENKAFITRDLLVVGQESASYSRRCVNDCDAVVMIIGHEYGQANQSGVSQLHLTYTNAKTKNKPMIVLINTDLSTQERNSHLTDFIKTVESQHPLIWYFNTHSKLTVLLSDALNKLSLPSPTWQQSKTFTKNKSLDTTAKTPMALDTLDAQLFGSILPTHKVSLDLNIAKVPTLALDDVFLADCSAHAFQGGTLFEVPFTLTLSWRQILKALLNLDSPFTDQSLTKTLNELIDKAQADKLVIQQHPNAHAISRHQLKKMTVSWIKENLHLAGWITPFNQNQWVINDSIKPTL